MDHMVTSMAVRIFLAKIVDILENSNDGK